MFFTTYSNTVKTKNFPASSCLLKQPSFTTVTINRSLPSQKQIQGICSVCQEWQFFGSLPPFFTFELIFSNSFFIYDILTTNKKIESLKKGKIHFFLRSKDMLFCVTKTKGLLERRDSQIFTKYSSFCCFSKQKLNSFGTLISREQNRKQILNKTKPEFFAKIILLHCFAKNGSFFNQNGHRHLLAKIVK